MLKMTLKTAKCSINGVALISPDIYKIGDSVFRGNEEIRVAVIPYFTEIIGNYAFADCPNLCKVIFTGRVKQIGNYAFSGCPSLTKLVFPSSVKYIGRNIVENTPLTEPIYCAGKAAIIKYPPGLLQSEYIMPKTVYTIAKYAFYKCMHLKSVTLSNIIEVIPSGAFFHCGMETMTIPASVKRIESEAFRACNDLRKVVFLSDETEVCDRAFVGSRQVELVFPGKTLRHDKYLQAIGESFLSPAGFNPADVSHGHLRNKYFKKLSALATAGNADAMYALSKFFDLRACRRARHTDAYIAFSNFWLYLAAKNGHAAAEKCVDEWLSENPDERWSSPISERMVGRIGGTTLRALGFMAQAESGREYTVADTHYDDVRMVSVLVGKKDGMELFDWWFTDVFLNPLEGISKKERLSGGKLWEVSREWNEELDRWKEAERKAKEGEGKG